MIDAEIAVPHGDVALGDFTGQLRQAARPRRRSVPVAGRHIRSPVPKTSIAAELTLVMIPLRSVVITPWSMLARMSRAKILI